MRAIVQRVLSASVAVEGETIGQCGRGLLLLVGVHKGDTEAEAKKLADKIAGLRIFNDPEGKMNLSLQDFDPNLEILAISNFTVYGDVRKQRRPSFMDSASFELGNELFHRFVDEMKALGIKIETGEFGADMQVSLVNDGPVTLVVDIEAPKNS
ncbi:MAG: D-tyrosyl-tRNA(Tyr) deacylase [Armatimonadetes bacterium]|nr:D-tyrosyl-tRNA(Tyr) deacylase [Armatimonadota bacterium]MBS1728175.1 D-tyrosyl-tRNA(Tyr) deacylase [Armatimonadota bacterium]